jgi:hypothetical protein
MPNLVVYRRGAVGIVATIRRGLHKNPGPGVIIPVYSLVLVDILAHPG